MISLDMDSFIYGWFWSSILFTIVIKWMLINQKDQLKTIRNQQEYMDKMYAHAKEIDNVIKTEKPNFVKIADKVMKEAKQ